MTTPLIDRIAAISASAVITLAMLQAVALLGHPRHAADRQVAQTGAMTTPAR